MKKMLHFALSLCLLTLLTACPNTPQPSIPNAAATTPTPILGDTVADLGPDIDGMYQDAQGVYWFVSNGQGLNRWDGKALTHITDKHGLCSVFIQSLQVDAQGKLWFGTRDGVCSFDGATFVNHSAEINSAVSGAIPRDQGTLFFGQTDAMVAYDGRGFTQFVIHPADYRPSPTDNNRPYSVYSRLIDRAGNVWFGTQERGVVRYDGQGMTYFVEHGLDQAAVRTLYQDAAGTIWAGNNGAGLFRFDGQGFVNVTEEKGLGNPDFLKGLKAKEGTLARPWTMAEGKDGKLYVGTIDSGVWRYDGKEFTNLTTQNGLSGNAIWFIYKDRQGELWFVVEGNAVFKLDGDRFVRFAFGG